MFRKPLINCKRINLIAVGLHQIRVNKQTTDLWFVLYIFGTVGIIKGAERFFQTMDGG